MPRESRRWRWLNRGWGGALVLYWAEQTVANAAPGLNDGRRARCTKLSAQSADIHIHNIGFGLRVAAPHAAHDSFAGAKRLGWRANNLRGSNSRAVRGTSTPRSCAVCSSVLMDRSPHCKLGLSTWGRLVAPMPPRAQAVLQSRRAFPGNHRRWRAAGGKVLHHHLRAACGRG
jgi:hypothetical protein